MQAQPEATWAKFIRLFSSENRDRPTRLAVFEGDPGDMADYWIENGMPLNGIDIDLSGTDGPHVQIMLGSEPEQHLTHNVRDARFIRITLSTSGESDGIEIGTGHGETTVLRFEDGAA